MDYKNFWRQRSLRWIIANHIFDLSHKSSPKANRIPQWLWEILLSPPSASCQLSHISCGCTVCEMHTILHWSYVCFLTKSKKLLINECRKWRFKSLLMKKCLKFNKRHLISGNRYTYTCHNRINIAWQKKSLF